jgi:hypothetical protein
MDEPVPFTYTDKALLLAARGRIEQLEYILRHFDRTSMDLHLYVRAVEGMPTPDQWQLIREQIWEMVDAYGPRNPNR